MKQITGNLKSNKRFFEIKKKKTSLISIIDCKTVNMFVTFKKPQVNFFEKPNVSF